VCQWVDLAAGQYGLPLAQSQANTDNEQMRRPGEPSSPGWSLGRCGVTCDSRPARMDTLAQFAKEDSVRGSRRCPLLRIQQNHNSSAIIERAHKLLTELSVQ
jgi:hypothetical protein